jgi:hypothetical protein
MSSIYEGLEDSDGLVRQFTSCCGAYDKGTEDGVVCRSCYNFIDDYYGLGEEEAFTLTIAKPTLVQNFNEMLNAQEDN